MAESARSGTARGPLHGILVADFTRVLAGPLATMFLGDLGATVIKVERSDGGDDSRAWGPPYVGSMSTYYTSVNRNKRSITLDLSDNQDVRLAQTLAARADVMIENFLPGKLAKFELDPDHVLRTNPRLVYCSITGFGNGNGAAARGYDFVVQAVGGLMSVTGEPGGEPTKVGVPFVDVVTGLHATIGIIAALRERDRSGRGQQVEVNLMSSLISSLVNQGSAFINGAGVPLAMGNQHPSVAPYEILQAQDAPLAVAVGSDRQFRVLAEALGLPEVANDQRFYSNADRVAHRSELTDQLEVVLKRDTATRWAAHLQGVGIACGPVNDIQGAIALASQLGLHPVASFPPSERTPAIATLANPLRLKLTPVRYKRRPPGLGADSNVVRRWLVRTSRHRPVTLDEKL